MNGQKIRKRVITIGIVLLVAGVAAGCATKTYVRQEMQTTAGKLSARRDEHDSKIQANTNQIAELTTVNKQANLRIDSVQAEVQQVDGKAVTAQRAAGQAQQTADQAQVNADKANSQVVGLGEQFMNRNQYNQINEKAVQFKLDDWKLDQTDRAELDDIAKSLKENPDAVAVLEGRTDATGDKDQNIQLGQRRIESVARYLVVEKEVPPYKIFKMSFGEDRPIADNGSRDGRSKNRCTIVRILAPKVDSRQLASR
jgi:outer membrane protein OmpA-like peptidoglycan-associated protein